MEITRTQQNTDESDRLKTTIRPHRFLWRQMEQACAIQEVTLSDAIEEAIEHWLRGVTKANPETLLKVTSPLKEFNRKDIEALFEYLAAWKVELKRLSEALDQLDIAQLLKQSKKQEPSDEKTSFPVKRKRSRGGSRRNPGAAQKL